MIFSSLNYLSSSPSYITRLYLDRQTLPPRASRSTDEFRKTSRYCCSQPSSIFQHPQAAPKDCFFTEFQLDISNPYLLLTMDTSRLLGKEWSESDAESESPTPDRLEKSPLSNTMQFWSSLSTKKYIVYLCSFLPLRIFHCFSSVLDVDMVSRSCLLWLSHTCYSIL